MGCTEDCNPRSEQIDTLSTREILHLINDEDQTVALRVREALEEIAQAVDLVADRLQQGGRVIYIGAGTSVRLAVADAAELPPTYGFRHDQFQVVVAGGRDAVFRAQEHAEDVKKEAITQLQVLDPQKEDVIIGLTASGTTPFVATGLNYGRLRGCATVLITCNNSPIQADVRIVALTGPEIVAGSTRMKAATAQKMVLTMLSTTVAIRLGLVYSGRMVSMQCENAKCKERAIRTVMDITGKDRSVCNEALLEAGGDIRIATLLLHVSDVNQAQQLLTKARGSLRIALSLANQPK